MRTIKKYGNRRLYDTTASAYVNLDGVADLIRGGEEVRIVDVKSGEDLTRQVLLQVLLEGQGAELVPVSLLHRMIRFSTDNPAQRAAMKQLAVGLELLEDQLHAAEQQWGWMSSFASEPPVSPFERRRPAAAAQEPAPAPEPEPSSPTPREPASDPELDELRARLEALEGRLRGRS